jgi:hypothetical protein
LNSFKHGDFELIRGGDPYAVHSYLSETADPGERTCEVLESTLECSSLESFSAQIVKVAIPPELVERCWEKLVVMGHDGNLDLYSRCLVAFLNTRMCLPAAQALRAQPPKSLPVDVAAATMLPTGNELLNQELLMITCKQGAAVEAACRSFRPDQIKVALEVISCVGVEGDENRQAVLHRCISCSNTADLTLNAASLRCLVSIGEAKSIPMEKLKQLAVYRNMTVRLAAFIAISKVTADGICLPEDLIDLIFAKIEATRLAHTVLVNACKRQEAAQVIVRRLIEQDGITPALWLRVMIQAAKHPDLRAAVRNAVRTPLQTDRSQDFDRALQKLRAKVE